MEQPWWNGSAASASSIRQASVIKTPKKLENVSTRNKVYTTQFALELGAFRKDTPTTVGWRITEQLCSKFELCTRSTTAHQKPLARSIPAVSVLPCTCDEHLRHSSVHLVWHFYCPSNPGLLTHATLWRYTWPQLIIEAQCQVYSFLFCVDWVKGGNCDDSVSNQSVNFSHQPSTFK